MSQPRPGDVFANRFEIDRIAGSGGMATVYRARDLQSGNVVALKIHDAKKVDSHDAERFSREAEVLSGLSHPGIVHYIAHGHTESGQRYLAMEWLDGEDLAHRLSRGPLLMRESLELIRNVAAALLRAHQAGIIHRDIKPSNLFLQHSDPAHAKLLDFGIARRTANPRPLTQTGMVLGTPEYMAPEQARGTKQLTPAADVFSLGCVLYECLTGEPPFVAEHIAAVLVRILFEDPTPIEKLRPGMPDSLNALSRSMLAKTPEDRPKDAAELIAAIDAIGDIDEVPLQRRRAQSAKQTGVFAESEQTVFTLVVAAEPRPETLSDTATRDTQSGGSAPRKTLLATLHSLGVRAEFLVSGSLVATVPQTGTMTDQVSFAAQVALLIKERWPGAEVAVATGRGVAHGAYAIGEVADRAASMLQRQTVGFALHSPRTSSGIFLDDLSARLLGPRFSVLKTDGGAKLVGEEKEVDASRPLLGKPTPCVGRDAELAILEGQLLGAIDNGEVRAVLITAAPGVGKSRLRHEFLRRVEKRGEPITILLGRGDHLSSGAPYAILGQAVRRLCGLSGSEPLETQRQALLERLGKHVAPGDRERVAHFIGECSGVPFPSESSAQLRVARKDPKVMSDRIRGAFLDWLSAEGQAAPILLVLDDMQWADGLTLQLLIDCLRDLQGVPLVCVALARPEVLEIFPQIRNGLKPQEVPLKGLPKKACDRLIQQVLGNKIPPQIIARAVEQSAGNALYLEELIRSIAEGEAATSDNAPQTVMAMLQSRIGRFEAGPRRALRAAAVFGQTFWDGGVARILGYSEMAPKVQEWIESLLAAEVIERHFDSRLAEQTEYGFRHALVRDAAYDLLTDSDLLTGHLSAGEFLEAAGASDAAAIAEHYRRGGQAERAAHQYQRAGDEAARLCSYAKAKQHFEEAYALIVDLPESATLRGRKADILLKQTQLGLRSDPREQSLERLATAQRFIEQREEGSEPSHEDRLRLAWTDCVRGQLFYYTGEPVEAIKYFRRVLPAAQELGDRELLMLPGSVIGVALALQGQMRKACALLTPVIEPLSEAGLLFDWIRARLILSMSLSGTGDHPAGLRYVAETLAHAQQINQPTILGISYLLHDCGVPRLGLDWAAIAERAQRAIDQSTQSSDQVYRFVAYGMRAWAASFLGQPEQAAADRETRVQIKQSMGGRMILADWFDASDADIALHAGRYDEARQIAIEVAARCGAAGLVMSQGIAERALGAALSRLGAPAEECDRHFATAIALHEDAGLVSEVALTRLYWARALQARGEAQRAAEEFSTAVARLEKSGCTFAAENARRLMEAS